MSDGIELNCPFCDGRTIKKESDYLKVKIKNQSLKHPEDEYESTLPVFTCEKCKRQCIIERVNKW